MLFKQEMIDAILTGKKTQARRVANDDDMTLFAPDGSTRAVYTLDKHGKLRMKWRVEQSYAIQPGRGKGGIYARLAMSGKYEWQTTQPDGNGGAQWKPMRIRITAIRRELLHAITESDAQAEGVESVAAYRELWERINTAKGVRWSDNPYVWVIEFELVKGGDAK